MSDKKQTVDLGLLEEDDEFEEFPAEGKYFCVFCEHIRCSFNFEQDIRSPKIIAARPRAVTQLG